MVFLLMAKQFLKNADMDLRTVYDLIGSTVLCHSLALGSKLCSTTFLKAK
jgi:hypothetical protein